MERMAAQGMKFTQAYASAVCSPTRVSALTGFGTCPDWRHITVGTST
ncbi:MAG: sulfatase-like hydrolase/transferase [Verrucomicrobia bacterium]|nr:sulfatase-like hydrolase/transferase [Verrucomicrobiota bacterium]